MAEHRAVLPLRIVLVLMFAILLVFQTLSLPGQFAHLADEAPELAYLRWPMTVLAVFWVLCVQVVIVCTWKLLTMVKRDRIFSAASMAWVDGIVWAVAAAWLTLAGVMVFLVLGWDDPGLPLFVLLLWIGVTALGLLMLVMRALLRQATTLQTDMEAVI